MISRMAKPEEVLVVENEQGEVVREFMKDTDSINMYKNMRETLGKSLHMPTHQLFFNRLFSSFLSCVCDLYAHGKSGKPNTSTKKKSL